MVQMLQIQQNFTMYKFATTGVVARSASNEITYEWTHPCNILDTNATGFE